MSHLAQRIVVGLVIATPVPNGGPGSLNPEWLAPMPLPLPAEPQPWMPAKTNPEDRRLNELCRIYDCTPDERRQVGEEVHAEKKGGGGSDAKNLPEDLLRRIIEEIIARRGDE